MIECDGTGGETHAPVTAGWVTAAVIAEMVRQLRDESVADPSADHAELVAQIGMLETLKAVASAVQAQRTSEFAVSREAELSRLAAHSSSRPSPHPSTGPSSPSAALRSRARQDVGAQVGLARRVGPRIGSRFVGLAKVLTGEMPATMTALRYGRIDEYQAMLVVAETSTLSLEHRQIVDAELGEKYGTMTPAQARGAAAAVGYRLDPDQAVRRMRKALCDRRVTLRPAPDSMTYLTALLPMVEGVGVLAALSRHAASATAAGDPRGRGALMADELVDRLLQAEADCSVDSSAPGPAQVTNSAEPEDTSDDVEGAEYLMDGVPALPRGVDVEIQLVMTDRTLFDGDDEPAILTGYGPVPAPLARHLARGADPRTKAWVRRLYADRDTGRLTGGDSRRRLFSHADRQFLIARDQVCRTPWCGAPIRHADHIRPYAAGGPTEVGNGAGLCVACNQVKVNPGWVTGTADDSTMVIATPAGQQYRSRPPDPPRSAPWADSPAALAVA